MATFRIGMGSLLLYQLLMNYPDRRFLYHPEGISGADLVDPSVEPLRAATSLFRLTNSVVAFEALYHVAIVVVAVWTTGVASRWLTPLICVASFSLHTANLSISDAGDNLADIVLLFAVFVDLRGDRATRPPTADRSVAAEISTALHNLGLTLIRAQVCIVYFTSGVLKLQGRLWQTGDALGAILRVREYEWQPVSGLVHQHEVLGQVLGYAVIALQLSFPLLVIIGPRARLLATLSSIGMHAGIGVLMGLVTFSGYMIVCDLSMITREDRKLLALPAGIRRTAHAIGTSCRRSVDRRPTPVLARRETRRRPPHDLVDGR